MLAANGVKKYLPAGGGTGHKSISNNPQDQWKRTHNPKNYQVTYFPAQGFGKKQDAQYKQVCQCFTFHFFRYGKTE